MEIKKGRSIYLWLFGTNFIISAFTFGGGYVVIPMIRKYYVNKKKLFTERELQDLVAVAQSSPGAIAINLSALAGYKTAGAKGTILACVASVLPPLIILSVVSAFYEAFRDNGIVSAVLKGMEAGVCALMVDVVWDMGKAIFREKQALLSMMIPASFAAVFFFQVNVMLVIAACAGICLLAGWIGKKRKAGNRNESSV